MLRVPRHPLPWPASATAGAAGRVARPPLFARAGRGRCSAASPRMRSGPFDTPLSSAIGVALSTAGHRYGWPVAADGSQSITDALAALLDDLGGKVETGVRVDVARRSRRRRHRHARPGAAAVAADPRRPAAVTGRARLPPLPARAGRVQGRLRRPGRRALDAQGGTSGRHRPPGRHLREIAAAERDVNAAGCPSARSCWSASSTWPTRAGRPGRTRCGPTRTCRTATAGDATEAIDRPDRALRPRVPRPHRRARPSAPSPQMGVQPELRRRRHRHRRQGPPAARVRPAGRARPYTLGVPGIYLCSAATPPGAGAHGMCGFNAAEAALARL